MNKIVFLFVLLFPAINLRAQIYDPVTWTTSFRHIEDDQYELLFEATIDPGWAIYSQYLENDLGPIPTSFNFEQGNHYELIDRCRESGHKKEGFDPIFEMNLVKFTDNAKFVQRIRLLQERPVSGFINYMTCDDTKCLPPADEEFIFKLKAGSDEKQVKDKKHKPSTNGEKGNTHTDLEEQTGDIEEYRQEEVFQDYDEGGSSQESDELLNPVHWEVTYYARQSGDQVIFTALIDEGWYIYGQETNPEGPIPTQFLFRETPLNVTELSSSKEETYDEIFRKDVVKLKNRAIYSFEVSKSNGFMSGHISYMTCNQEKCIFPEPVFFSIDPFRQKAMVSGEPFDLTDLNTPIKASFPLHVKNLDSPAAECLGISAETVDKKGMWNIFLLGFIGGLLALLTPCVFPMIPLTVSFFTKGSVQRKKGFHQATLYGFFILLTYLILSIPFHLMDSVNPDILNDISTNIWLNIGFFVIFLVFAFSFFGYYELTLPSSWTNKVSRAEGVGGAFGILFMALTLALVSFSCTGPILGSLLAGALTSDGGAWQLTSGMGGFGLALALPFALFAAFPGWLGSLPRSGGWLNTVKVVLGFLELALAFKFLSNADLVKRWGLLKIEPFLVIWILIAVGLGLYLLGKIKFPHDPIPKRLSFLRVSLAVASFLFAAYLGTGFISNPATGTFRSLTLLSGLAPPVGYSWVYPNKCPQNLNCFKDLDSGVEYARKTKKPIILDFTGHACVNCRKMEELVWPSSQVLKQLKNDFILISLYVDERIELPENEQITVVKKTGGTRKLRTYGNKWTHFQTELFNNNSQPYYALVTPDGTLLNKPLGYTPDAQEYAAFLKCGYEAFEELNGSNTLGYDYED